MSDPGADMEDIEACAREGRRPRDAGPYRVSFGNALFQFRPVTVPEPAVSGRALRELAELSPPEQHVCFALLVGGLLEEVRLDETIDLRAGVEKFISFESDRMFRFTIDGAEYQWGGAFITGATILKLANADPARHSVQLVRRDGSERAVAATSLIDLAEPGVEAFAVVKTAEA